MQGVLERQFAVKPADPTRDGFVFTGWYYDSALFDFAGTPILADITLTAGWTPEIVDPILVSVFPSAAVEKLSGSTNNLKITIIGVYSDGSTKVIAEKTFSIDNNSAGSYEVGAYKVYVDTKGNNQIRECYLE
jgi:uncharacterized repeat protein (TIGR02543 family)